MPLLLDRAQRTKPPPPRLAIGTPESIDVPGAGLSCPCAGRCGASSHISTAHATPDHSLTDAEATAGLDASPPSPLAPSCERQHPKEDPQASHPSRRALLLNHRSADRSSTVPLIVPRPDQTKPVRPALKHTPPGRHRERGVTFARPLDPPYPHPHLSRAHINQRPSYVDLTTQQLAKAAAEV